MKSLELPPIASAQGRLRQNRPTPRGWLFAALPPELKPALEPLPGNDFLITNLAPELTPGTKAPALVQDYPVPVPGAEAARNTYWFDL